MFEQQCSERASVGVQIAEHRLDDRAVVRPPHRKGSRNDVVDVERGMRRGPLQQIANVIDGLPFSDGDSDLHACKTNQSGHTRTPTHTHTFAT